MLALVSESELYIATRCIMTTLISHEIDWFLGIKEGTLVSNEQGDAANFSG